MNKDELIARGFKYAATQNNDSKIEVWTKFSGWQDVVQYYYYSPLKDETISPILTMNYSQFSLYEKIYTTLQDDFINKSIEVDESALWL